ncbi:nuclease-related domain-containing protein [Piscibacillus sp. B03]|uniref:nuclease-related domain-containing protein n=1 Tax=Piscibacillus sp. B03 TaxID=3457430 RepID=UPI003FCC33C5
MILKSHEIPYNLLSIIVIILRLTNSHPMSSKSHQFAANYYSGYKGELALDYFIKFIDQKDYIILHDVRLPFMNNYFQIDTLILTPNFIVIIEVKNLTGNIRFNHDMGRLYQYMDHEERSYQDPLLQVSTQAHQFKSFLYNLGLSHIPIESLIVFVNQRASLSEERDSRVIYGFQLKQRFDELKGKYESSNPIKVNALSQKILSQHKPLKLDMLKHLGIHLEELRNGVICPHCLSLPMERKHGRWFCGTCKETSRAEAHIRTFYEHALLTSRTINNSTARNLLNIQSIHTVQKLLKRAGFTSHGETSNRYYTIDADLQTEAKYLLDYYQRMRFGEKKPVIGESSR